jgi:hypothetical protein
MALKRVVGTAKQDSIETPFRNLIGDSKPCVAFFPTGIVIILRCDNVSARGADPCPAA